MPFIVLTHRTLTPGWTSARANRETVEGNKPRNKAYLQRMAPAAALRFFNVFGPRQDSKGAYAAAVPTFIEKAVRNEDITVFGDGGQTRDFIDVNDTVGALSFEAEAPGVTGDFNAGYGGQITINDLANCLIKAAASTSKILHAPERAGDVSASVMSGIPAPASKSSAPPAGSRATAPRPALRRLWNFSAAAESWICAGFSTQPQ